MKEKMLQDVTGGKEETEATEPVYYIDPARCVLCGECEALCPMAAISKGRNAYVIDTKRCIMCGVCRRNCPYGIPDIVPRPVQ